MKAEAHAAASGLAGSRLLEARLGETGGDFSPRDLHMYTLADHVHWAAGGARLAIVYLLGEHPAPAPNAAKSFGDLYAHLDGTIAHLREVDPDQLDAGLERTIVMEHPRASVRSSGRQFLVAFAIPHFFYHLTTAYGILRNRGVALTMGDFLGDWPTEST